MFSMNMEKKQFAVIGLGRFGLALCEELMDQGAQVLALDIDEERVKLAAETSSHAIIADCSDEETVAELKLDEYDIVMVAIGDDINTSVLATLVLKELGVKNVFVFVNASPIGVLPPAVRSLQFISFAFVNPR